MVITARLAIGPINVAPARSRRAEDSLLRAGAAAADSFGRPVAAVAGPMPLLVPRVSDSAGPVPSEPPRLRLMAFPDPPAPAPVTAVAGPHAALGTPAAPVPATVRGSFC